MSIQSINKTEFLTATKVETKKAEQKHDNKAISDNKEYVSSAGSAALRSMFMAGLTTNPALQALKGARIVKTLQAGDYTISGKYRVIAERSCMEVNHTLAKRGLDTPYLTKKDAKEGENTNVQILELTEPTRFVRTYDGKNSGMKGSWVMRYDDVKDLTPEEIAEKYALPQVPKYMCDVVLQPGDKVRMGIAGPLYGHEGRGVQFDLMVNDGYVGTFENEREITGKNN